MGITLAGWTAGSRAANSGRSNSPPVEADADARATVHAGTLTGRGSGDRFVGRRWTRRRGEYRAPATSQIDHTGMRRTVNEVSATFVARTIRLDAPVGTPGPVPRWTVWRTAGTSVSDRPAVSSPSARHGSRLRRAGTPGCREGRSSSILTRRVDLPCSITPSSRSSSHSSRSVGTALRPGGFCLPPG